MAKISALKIVSAPAIRIILGIEAFHTSQHMQNETRIQGLRTQ